MEAAEGKIKRTAPESRRDDPREKYVIDSSIDHRGRVPLRASTGCWKASLFIIAIEFSERLCYFGIATNLIIYLTQVLHKDIKTAAKNANYWNGAVLTMPLIGGFIADAYLGRFCTVILSTIVYLAGLGLLAMSHLVPGLKPCNPAICHRSLQTHEVIFFIAMYLISVGTGGHKSSLESFGADQFDDNHAEERKKKMSFFNWWNFGLCSGLILGVTGIVYVQDYVSWASSYIALIAVMASSLLAFVVGKPFYRFQTPQGSPLTQLLQVLVAAVAKRHIPLPDQDDKLYEVHKSKRRLLSHTNNLRFLDKAAVVEHKDDEAAFSVERGNPWRLATVTQVEELKLILSVVRVWVVTLPFGICVAQTSTFFIKQASTMDRKLSSSFDIPPASICALAAIGMIISVTLYDKVLLPFLRKATGEERGMSILHRIGVGMIFSAMAMVCAAIVERKRLKVAEDGQRSSAGMVSMSAFWLAPQFMLLGFGDGFALVGLQEYFYDQVPDGMRSLGIALYLSVVGAGHFLSSLLITVVGHATGRGGRASWFGDDLNTSRLDLFYWLLAVLNAINLCAYVYVASRYSYKNVHIRVAIGDCPEDDA